MSVIIAILISFHVIVCLLMIGVVLMQRPKSEGLGAAFGGGMTENMFGAQTTHVLQKFTVWLGITFFALTLILAVLFAKRGTGETAVQRELMAQPIPAASPATGTHAVPATPEATAAPADVTPVVVEEQAVNGVQESPAVEPATETDPAESTHEEPAK